MIDWDLLGIDPTDDVQAIKQAYAKQLKTYHPEDDAAGYQQLRETYDQAVKEAKRRKRTHAAAGAEDSPQADMSSVSVYTQAFTKEPPAADPLEQFIEKAEALYKDYQARMKTENWQELLQDQVVWNVSRADEVKTEMFYFLNEHPHLPFEVWQLLDSTFSLLDELDEAAYLIGPEAADELKNRILGRRLLGFHDFQGAFDYDAYLSLRNAAQSAFQEQDFELAGELLQQGYGIYQKDPDLLRLKAFYYMEQHNDADALQALDEALVLDPADADCQLMKARILYDRGDFAAAETLSRGLLDQPPYDMEAAHLYAKSAVALRDDVEAAFERILEVWNRHVDRRYELIPAVNMLTKVRREMGIARKQTSEEEVKRQWFATPLFFLLLCIGRTWIYGLAMIVLLFTPIPFIYISLLFIPIGWEILKVSRVLLISSREAREART